MSVFPEYKYAEVCPAIVILTNVVSDVEGDVPKYEGCDKIKTILRDVGYLVEKVEDVWPFSGYKGFLLVHFQDSDAGSISAMKLHYQFMMAKRGTADLDPEERDLPGPYGWIATEADYAILRRIVQSEFLSNDILGTSCMQANQYPVDAPKALCEAIGVPPGVSADCNGGYDNWSPSSEEEESRAVEKTALP